MRLKPLEQFVCDSCGELIEKPEDGWLEWLVEPDRDFEMHDFRVVHHYIASPRKQHGGRCQYPSHINLTVADMHLDHFLGPDGLAKLLSKLDEKFTNPQEFIEIIRRLHIPHYEEARIFWHQANADGYFDEANEYWPYLQDNLIRLIDLYGG